MALNFAEIARRTAAAGRPEEARRLYLRALDVDPADLEAATGLAENALNLGRLGEAVHWARVAGGLKQVTLQSTTIIRKLGLSLFSAGLWEEATVWLGKARDRLPWDLEVKEAWRVAQRPDYLQPVAFDPKVGRPLERYAAREGRSYIYTIDIVGTCNLRCPTCPVGNSPARKIGFMRLEMFLAILGKIKREAPCDQPQINLFNWGEPLLHPDLPQIISSIREKGMRSHLSTNLNITRGLEEVLRAEPTDLKISVSGFSAETYSKTHVRGDIDLFMKNLEQVRKIVDDHKISTNIWISQHVYKNNLHEQPLIRNICENLGFSYHPIPAFFMPLERVIEIVEGRTVVGDDHIVKNLLTPLEDSNRRAREIRSGKYDCELRFNQTVINYDGSVALCCSVFDESNMLNVQFLDKDFSELEALKYQHDFCSKCISGGFHYAPAEMERLIAIERGQCEF